MVRLITGGVQSRDDFFFVNESVREISSFGFGPIVCVDTQSIDIHVVYRLNM